MMNSVPTFSWLCTSIVPRCAWTMPYEMASPSPVPWPIGFVVKKGSKMRWRIVSGMPFPVSRTEMENISSACEVVITILPRPSMAYRALASRFIRTWLTPPA